MSFLLFHQLKISRRTNEIPGYLSLDTVRCWVMGCFICILCAEYNNNNNNNFQDELKIPGDFQELWIPCVFEYDSISRICFGSLPKFNDLFFWPMIYLPITFQVILLIANGSKDSMLANGGRGDYCWRLMEILMITAILTTEWYTIH